MTVERGFVAIGAHKLRLTINALCQAEEAAGVRIPALILAAQIEGALGFTDVRLLVWAGRLFENPEFTLDEAESLIEEVGFRVAAAAVEVAVLSAFPAPSAEGKGEASLTNPQDGTG